TISWSYPIKAGMKAFSFIFILDKDSTFQPKNKGLVVEIFDWDDKENTEDEKVTQVKVLMALADDELTVGKSHARKGEGVDISIRK
nr:retrovirus-related Pol polyprotein from transposon TNT 1-94 [Tanacetum cinerariifolium]